MTTEYIYVPMAFNYKKFAYDIKVNRSRNNLTQREVDSMIEVEGACARSEQERVGSGGENIAMKTFIELCNLFGLNPADYFCFEDRIG